MSAKFMGVDMERVELDLQELLRLQYEGQVGPTTSPPCTSAPLHQHQHLSTMHQAVLNLFGKAKVNVNLLLHFLNAKFYGK